MLKTNSCHSQIINEYAGLNSIRPKQGSAVFFHLQPLLLPVTGCGSALQ
jgi:L,D-peptidoglycan transpeptidase YkuD (ErfK/YbiS/YcfS/YnhG family)